MKEIDLGFNPKNQPEEHGPWFDMGGQVLVEAYVRSIIFWDGPPYVVHGNQEAVQEWIDSRKLSTSRPLMELMHGYATVFGRKHNYTCSNLHNCPGVCVSRTDLASKYILDYFCIERLKQSRTPRKRWVFHIRWQPSPQIFLETRHIPKRCPREILKYLKMR